MQKREMNAELAPQPASSYSQAVEVTDADRILLISGQLGIEADGITPVRHGGTGTPFPGAIAASKY